MSVIAVPLGSGAVVSPIRELARVMARRADAVRAPFFVVPPRNEGWSELGGGGGIVVSADAATFRERIDTAIAAVQDYRVAHAYRSSETRPKEDGLDDLLLFIPIIVAETPEDIRRSVDELAAVTTEMTAALEGAFRGTALVGFPAVRFLPWAFLPDAGSIARELFRGPSFVGGGETRPIIRFAEGRGTRNRWRGYGENQLIVDLVALHSVAAAGGVGLPLLAQQSSGRPQFFVCHGALVELPCRRAALRGLLRELVAGATPLLTTEPAPQEVFDAETAAAADAQVEQLGQLLAREEVKLDAFGSDGRWLGVSVDFAPERADFAKLSFDRKLDSLHTRFLGALRTTAPHVIDEKSSAALAEVQTTLTQLEGKMQQSLQNELTAPSQNALGAGAMMRAAALSTRLQELLSSADTKGPAEDLDRIVDSATSRRHDWCGREEALWRAGSRIPQPPAVKTGTAAVAVAILVIGWVIFHALSRRYDWHPAIAPAASVVTTIVLAVAFYYLLEQSVRDYFRRWSELEDYVSSEMRGFCDRLRRFCNERLRSLKAATVPGLLRRLNAAHTRLRTEIAGLTSLCREDLEQLERAVSEDVARDAKPEHGRFRFDGDLPGEKRDTVRNELTQLLGNVLTLHAAPAWISLDDYRGVLRKGEQELGNDGRFAAVQATVERARVYTRDEHFKPVFNDVHFAALPMWELELGGARAARYVEPPLRLAYELPDETALLWTVRGYEMAPDGER